MAGFGNDLLGADHEHLYVDTGGNQHWVTTLKGVPQGMPLASYMFPLAIKQPLQGLQEGVDRMRGGGKVVAYLDDVYVMAKPKHFDAIIHNAAWQFIQVGLELKQSKTECWARSSEPDNKEAEAQGARRTPEPVVLKQARPMGLTGQT